MDNASLATRAVANSPDVGAPASFNGVVGGIAGGSALDRARQGAAMTVLRILDLATPATPQ